MEIKTKYDIGQIVWVIDEPFRFGEKEPMKRMIAEIRIDRTGLIYAMHPLPTAMARAFYAEFEIFETKQDLLNSL